MCAVAHEILWCFSPEGMESVLSSFPWTVVDSHVGEVCLHAHPSWGVGVGV